MSTFANFFARKVDSSHIYEGYKMVQVTLLEICPINFVRKKTVDKDGYSAIVLGCGNSVKQKNVAKPQQKEFEKNGCEVRDFTFEVKSDNLQSMNLENGVNFCNFDESIVGMSFDVRAKVKGRGFTGTVKRWNFATQDATHGNSRSHRVPGSTGNRQDPGRVFKGKKMCGHYGDKFVTVKSLKVMYYNAEKKLIALSGSIPGANGGLVEIRSNLTSFRTKPSSISNLNGVKIV